MNVFGRLSRFVDDTACPVLLYTSYISANMARSTVSRRSGSDTPPQKQHLRLLLWRQGSTTEQVGSHLQVRDHHVLILGLHHPVVHALPMSTSCRVPGSRSLVHSWLCKFSVGVVQDLPDLLKVLRSIKVFHFQVVHSVLDACTCNTTGNASS